MLLILVVQPWWSGGRQLDEAPATIDVLPRFLRPACVKAARGSSESMDVDGGIRSGVTGDL
ncbi:Aldolase-type TIM barrel [Penicillium bovifimosum]|uniref:Aldolase-type TIM barrel n=1 Tax=Penicillium bovifimosum TaxID=126998 RepID=A0A9W9GUR8_9EURO|nr:Aldolase-type TIM barrel [Penicillium bovifimosum]KAJ5130422.1 Aldolase-type TIM barrel [Penicillium bovifimosum]